MIDRIKNKLYRDHSAFTLVELIVAISLFAVLVTISSGVFIRSLRAQRAITAFIAANSNASLTIEQIAREVRTGKDFCIQDPSESENPCVSVSNDGQVSQYQKLIFTNARGEKVTYSLIAPSDNSENQMKSLGRQIAGDSIPTPMTAENVDVVALSFYLQGHGPTENIQPRITIVMGVSAADLPAGGFTSYLQTTLSPRVPKELTPL